MGSKDYALRSVNIMNIVLLSAASLMFTNGASPLLEAGRYAEPLQMKRAAVEAGAAPSFRIPAAADYLIISEQNVFHPERKLQTAAAEKALPRPDLVLYGTMVADDYSAAYVEDLRAPWSTPGRGKRQKVLKKGDSVSGFVLNEIMKDRIILSRGEEEMTVAITPGEKKRAAADTAAAPATAAPASKSPSIPVSAAAPAANNPAKAKAAASAAVRPADSRMLPSSQAPKPRLPARPGVKRMPFNKTQQ